MQVNVSARHGELQNGDQALIVEKTERLRRLYDRVNSIEVTVDLKDKPNVEIVVSAEATDDLVGHAESSTVMAALDLAIPKLEHQLRRVKEKKTQHRAVGHKHIDPAPES